jgi:hypothetical protein
MSIIFVNSYPTLNYSNFSPWAHENILITVPLLLAVATLDPFGESFIMVTAKLCNLDTFEMSFYIKLL